MILKTCFLDVIFKHYFDFKGRAGVSQFWLFVLFNVFIIVINTTFFGRIGEIIAHTYILLVLCPFLGITVRRLRDAGFSPWILLIPIPVMLGSFWLGSQFWSPNGVVPNLGEWMNLVCYMVIPLAGLLLPLPIILTLLILPSKK